MAYINVEAGGADYRVILGNHRLTTPGSQLPDNCTGVVIEGSIFSPDLFYEALEGEKKFQKDTFVIQYSQLREKCQKKQIPIIAGEPLTKWSAVGIRANAYASRIFNTIVHISRAYRYNKLYLLDAASSENEILRDSQLFRDLREAIEYDDRRNPAIMIIPKNILITERAQFFAESQRRKDTKKPNIAIVVGAMHMGVIDALEMSTEERAAYLKSNSYIKGYYNAGSLADIFYVAYNPRRKNWSRHVLVDRNLKS